MEAFFTTLATAAAAGSWPAALAIAVCAICLALVAIVIGWALLR